VCSEIPDLPEVVEGVVCRSNEVQEGEVKEAELAGHPLLLVRRDGEVRALGARCTHYGARLVTGHYDAAAGTVRCPWHGACFSTQTGDIEDFPGLDSLACHRVEEVEGNLVVAADKRELVSGRRQQVGGDSVRDDGPEWAVVVGGGAAGHTAVETLRREGFTGKISLVTKEQHLPYDRPKLSKDLSVKPEQITLRKAGWYDKAKIEVIRGAEVVSVDPVEKTVSLADGEQLPYTKLLLCTGGQPRLLGVPGEELSGVSTLRTVTQANTIHREAAGKHVVIIGTSFIGMEVAAALVETAASVTVIGRDTVPFQGSLGREVGRVIAELHREHGVQFCMEEQVAELCAEPGTTRLGSVLLRSERRLKADLAVVGIGVTPATDAIAGIETDERGFLPVDSRMSTGLPDVWAAGDIVTFPLTTYSGQRASIGHWGLAMYLGRVAALNMMGGEKEAHTVPFFWTVQFGKSLRFAGLATGWDSLELEREEGKLLAFYCRGETVLAVATLGRDPVAAAFANLVKSGKHLSKTEALEWSKQILS